MITQSLHTRHVITLSHTQRSRVKIFSGADADAAAVSVFFSGYNLVLAFFSCMTQNAAEFRTSSSARVGKHPVEVADRGNSISICEKKEEHN